MRTLLATASLLALAVFLFGSASSSLFATPGAAPAGYAYAYAPAQTAPTAYVNAVPYAQYAPPVAYTEQAGSSMGSTATYAAAGALVGAIAALAVSGRDARPARQQSRASAPMMFFSGDPNKFDARASFKSAPKESLLKTGKSATKVKSKKAISTKKTGSSFIDVTGRSYQEVSTFVPQYDEVGVLPPLGRWDPLQIREQGPERYRRFVEMEIKHGRLAMAGFLGVLTTYSGVRFPGYLSTSENIKFSDIPGGAISSWAALPTAAWFQIVIFISFCEINFLKQDPEKEPGDVVPPGVPWARYPDGYDVWLGDGSTKQVGKDELILGRTWKLNAERNNGRAAMMGMTGLIIHEALTGNPFFPIGETL
jgi:light-harvesting complex I chlorophyll a/b binding protein 1